MQRCFRTSRFVTQCSTVPHFIPPTESTLGTKGTAEVKTPAASELIYFLITVALHQVSDIQSLYAQGVTTSQKGPSRSQQD